MEAEQAAAWVDSAGNLGLVGLVVLAVRWLRVSGWGQKLGELVVAATRAAERHVEHTRQVEQHHDAQVRHMATEEELLRVIAQQREDAAA